MGEITLLNIDCMEYMKDQPDNAFDLAIVDPPYGIDIMHGGGQPESKDFLKWERKDWDNSPPDSVYFSELIRISGNQIIWGGNYFVENLWSTQCWLAWDKMQKGFTFADFELAWTSFNSACRAFSMSRVEAYTNQNKIHPTQKPIKLYKWLLTNYAKPEQRILDTHLGSGSSAIAAYYFGCDFVGCEIDKDYYDAAVERFNNETKQMSLIK